VIATYQWRSQTPDPWAGLKRHRFELGLAIAGLALGLLIWTNMDRATPSHDDIEQALDNYVQSLRSSRSLNGGSLSLEMQADVVGPHVARLDISRQQQFASYWTIDAVMEVDQVGRLPIEAPIRLRVARRDGAWVVVDAEDLARHMPLRQ
jgi:hypothetical protein